MLVVGSKLFCTVRKCHDLSTFSLCLFKLFPRKIQFLRNFFSGSVLHVDFKVGFLENWNNEVVTFPSASVTVSETI